MAGIPADFIGKLYFTTYSYFPGLFTGNYTLVDIFAAVRYNGTVLSVIANATGLNEQDIVETVDLYFAVMQYLQPTTATPPSNTTNR